jgi:hypothetical protein
LSSSSNAPPLLRKSDRPGFHKNEDSRFEFLGSNVKKLPENGKRTFFEFVYALAAIINH